MASGALGVVERQRGKKNLKKRSHHRVKEYNLPAAPAVVRSEEEEEEDEFAHLFRPNEEFDDDDAADGEVGKHQDDVLVSEDEVEGGGFVASEDLVLIDFSKLRSKEDVLAWRRRLREELDQVRDLVKQIEDQETGYGSNSSHAGANRDENERQMYSETPCQEQVELCDLGRSGGLKSAKKAAKTSKGRDPHVDKENVPLSRSGQKPVAGARESDGYVVQALKSCRSLLTQLMKHKFGWVFNAPVDAKRLKLYDYHTIIKQPMDLGKVKDRLMTGWYESPMEFVEDVRRTFGNAMIYNPKGHDVYHMAEQLLEIFEKKWLVIEDKYNQDMKLSVGSEEDMAAPTLENVSRPLTPSMRTSDAMESSYSEAPANSESPYQEVLPEELEVQRTTPSMGSMDGLESSRSATPVDSASTSPDAIPEMVEVQRTTPSTRTPNALESNSSGMPVNIESPSQEAIPEVPEAPRDMSLQEKLKLNASIQELPSVKLDGIVDIIKKRHTALFQNDDELDLDINCLDAETLWELDNYVMECNNNSDKKKRKAEISYQTSTDMDSAPLERSASKVPRIYEERGFSSHGQQRIENGIRSNNDGSYLYSSSKDLDQYRYC